MFRRLCLILLVADVLLGLAHVLWPEYQWGQGRDSYFYLGNSLTLASWLVSMQLVGVALLAMVAFHRERRRFESLASWTTAIWPLAAVAALGLSLVEMTRPHHRMGWLGYPRPDLYGVLALLPLAAAVLALFGWFLLARLRERTDDRSFAAAWLAAWGCALLMAAAAPVVPEGYRSVADLGRGLALLFGCTLLLRAVGGYALAPRAAAGEAAAAPVTVAPYPDDARRRWILAGVGGCTFTIIFLQIVLFQMLTIFGDYVTAHTVLSIALLGISVGGLIGFVTAERAPLPTMIAAALLLPLTILAAFGLAVRGLGTPLLASLLLMLPFVACSAAITVALARSRSHVVYFVDLLGAAAGAFVVSWALGSFREESTLLLLCGFALLVAGCFVMAHPSGELRRRLSLVVAAGCVLFATVGLLNLRADWFNIVRTDLSSQYPEMELLFSRSSFVGRYDVIRTSPSSSVLKAVENGRVIDTIRTRTEEAYRIDPRLPHTLMDDPVILILGLSGDAITKTAKLASDQVVGIEINPAIVDLQRGELRPHNGNSYDGIDVRLMDGRTFAEQSTDSFDMITLLNAHFAKGYVTGRSASPEYLQTREAFVTYLERLTDRGIVNIEEPVGRPDREPQVWKLLVTMRQALLDHGAAQPAQHFFVFQWKTLNNNYFQILMKKTPFAADEVGRLRDWLRQVDELPQAEQAAGRPLGPIKAVTTLLYAPDGAFGTNVARLIEGRAEPEFLSAYNLVPITDNRPFPFDVDPTRAETRGAYERTLWMVLLLLPFFAAFLRRHRGQLASALPYVSVVALTGMGYLLIEVVLIQRYTIYLGSPVVTFSTVLGSLLIFSGLGSLWSGRIGRGGLYAALAGLFVLLLLHLDSIPALLGAIGARATPLKVLLTVLSLAPLAFCMGVPFPFVLRKGKERLSAASAAMLFAINAATSALAVPLALNVSTAWGMAQVLMVAVAIYAAVALSLIGADRPRLLASANGTAYALLALLFVAPWWLARPAQAEPTGEPRYEIFGLTCGNSFHREDRVMRGGSSRVRVPFEWMFWLVRGNGRTVLVDTGFDDPELIKQWQVRAYADPRRRLAALGIDPDDVTDVVLTHSHWDHIGGLRAFRRARVWVQEQEYEFARATVTPERPSARGLRWEDLEVLLEAEAEDRLTRVDGERELVPGIAMQLGGAHTPGMQYVTVDTLDGPVVIAGDTTYLYWNNQRHVPIGTAVDFDANLRTIRELHRIAASPFLILPGHDRQVMRWFPEVADGVVRVTARAR